MDFFVEDFGKVAKLRVDAKNVEFQGIEPKNLGPIMVAQIGNAKVVACVGATQEQLLEQLKNEEFCKAVQNTWVLAIRDSESCDEFAQIAHPYLTIADEDQAQKYERFSRGWNVEGESGVYVLRKCLGIGSNTCVEILFGESRENPVGLLSVKCVNK